MATPLPSSPRRLQPDELLSTKPSSPLLLWDSTRACLHDEISSHPTMDPSQAQSRGTDSRDDSVSTSLLHKSPSYAEVSTLGHRIPNCTTFPSKRDKLLTVRGGSAAAPLSTLSPVLPPPTTLSSLKKNSMDDTITCPSVPSTSPNLLDKWLFRSGTPSFTASPMTSKESMGSVPEDEVDAMNVVVMNTNLVPPPFANMYACESCREDIGSLLSQGRHHCRNCGGSFCAECTTHSIVVPYRAYLARGELRVCDGCYYRIQNFQKQVKSISVTWSGLQPPSSEQLMQDFDLSEDESPVAIFNCALFLDTTPFYGHLVLTRKRLCFQSYADAKKRKVAYSRVLSLLKPQFYYINGLQVKTKQRETFFLAEFNGLRDTCFLRIDQLIRAYQEARKLKGMRPGKSSSTKELRRQALDRRRSYKLISEHIASSGGCTSNSSSSLISYSSFISTVGFIDVDDEDFTADAPLSGIVEDCGHIDDGKSTASDEEPFEPLPPDPLLEKMTILLDCELRADVKRVFDLLWNDGPGQEFLRTTMEKARDIDIEVEPWKTDDKNDPVTTAEVRKGFEISKENDYTLYRTVRSQHPPKTSFPGLPPYAGCTRTQRFRLDESSNDGEKWDRFVITELNRMSKIPFSDYFVVEMRYVFSRDGNNYCHVQVGLVVNFLKATWFKSQINSSTRSESKEALESWAKQSIEFLECQRNRIVPLSPTIDALTASGSFSELVSGVDSALHPASAHSTFKSANISAAQSSSSLTTATSAIRRVWPPLSVVQVLLLGLLAYGLLVLRGHQIQMQRLVDETTKLLEQLQNQQSMLQAQTSTRQQSTDDFLYYQDTIET
uniref:FYVE-type domain-containing protein n=1 Tax=Hyaloperonospora arabidopsidis (strain Emoy2) TaxID=559515 RepID=M4B7U9_HYAAE